MYIESGFFSQIEIGTDCKFENTNTTWTCIGSETVLTENFLIHTNVQKVQVESGTIERIPVNLKTEM